MPKLNSDSSGATIISSPKEAKTDIKSAISGFPNRIKNIFSNLGTEDILLFIVLFILIEEGVEDDFLIIALILLILTE